MNLFHLLLLPFLSALICLLLRRNIRMQELASLALSFLYLVLASYLLWHVDQVNDHHMLVQQAGAWAAPFGISLVADRLGAVMLFINAFVGFVVSVYALAPFLRLWKSAEFHPLLHFLIGGVGGAFLTGDFFNLYVFFEILLLASFAMMVQGRELKQLQGAVKYVLLSLLASMMFLGGLGFLYNGLGTLNMADVGRSLQAGEWNFATTAGFSLLFFAFAAKAGLFPLYFWLPSSYPRTPLLTTALFAGLLTKVGVYAMIRLYVLAGPSLPESYRNLILWLSLITMFVGVMSAASKMEIRNILSFHIISQIGYITLGLAYMTRLALIGTVFYLIHHIVVKANLFLVTGVIERYFGQTHLKHIGGMRAKSLFWTICFLIPALSLAGIPPLSGFWAKFFVLQAAWEAGDGMAVAVGLLVGLFTLYSMIKILLEAFWKDPVEATPADVPMKDRRPMAIAIGIFCLWTLVMGLGLPWSYGLAMRTSDQLLDSKAYIERVLSPPVAQTEGEAP